MARPLASRHAARASGPLVSGRCRLSEIVILIIVIIYDRAPSWLPIGRKLILARDATDHPRNLTAIRTRTAAPLRPTPSPPLCLFPVPCPLAPPGLGALRLSCAARLRTARGGGVLGSPSPSSGRSPLRAWGGVVSLNLHQRIRPEMGRGGRLGPGFRASLPQPCRRAIQSNPIQY